MLPTQPEPQPQLDEKPRFASFKDMPIWQSALAAAERVFAFTERLPRKTRFATRGTTVRVVSQITGGIICPVTCGVVGGITGRVTRHMTPGVTGSASVPVAGKPICGATGEAAKEAHRGTAVEIALRTVRQGLWPTMAETAPTTMYDTTICTTLQTTSGVIPRVGVSVWRWTPNALGRKEISRKALSAE